MSCTSSGSAYHLMPVLRGPNCPKRAADHVWPLLNDTNSSALFPQNSKIVCPKDGLDLRGAWLCHPTYLTTLTRCPAQTLLSPGMANTIGRNWHRSRFPCISKLPTLEAAPHPTQSALRERSRGLGKGGKAGKREGKYHGLKVLDRAPEKVCPDRPWPCDLILQLGDHWVFSM